MSRAALAAALAVAAAVALVAAPSRAFVQSKTDQGQCLWWPQPVGIPVVANVTDGPTGAGCSGSTQVDALVRASLATWGAARRPSESQACTNLRFDYQGLTASREVGFNQGGPNQNLIVFRHGACSGNPACTGTSIEELEACADRIGCWPHDTGTRTIAITTTSFRQSTGQIIDADMELHDNSARGVGFFFTCNDTGSYCGTNVAPNGSCVSTDVGSIVTHEAGHMLGLDHPPDTRAVMYAFYEPGSTSARRLALDDVNGVCALYPAGSAPNSTCSDGSSTPFTEPRSGGGGGCSTAMGGALSMIGVALALGYRRASRRA